jgi:antitoxin (DNA-binding transcriptional repressor) of toxin-antitoxin stability system
MRRVTATQAARQFATLLDTVEQEGETFEVVRRGRAIATLSPLPRSNGKRIKEILRRAPIDETWSDDIRSADDFLEDREHSWDD